MSKDVKGWMGGKWEKKIVFVHYESNNEVISRTEHYDIADLIHTLSHKAQSQITKLSAFIIRLAIWFPILKILKLAKVATHHFIEMETNDGSIYTFEKGTEYILVQLRSKLIVTNPDALQPYQDQEKSSTIMREMREGKKRANLETLQKIITDSDQRDRAVKDVFNFCSEELKERYHLANSNCQHFSANLWNILRSPSSKPYPNPSKYLPLQEGK